MPQNLSANGSREAFKLKRSLLLYLSQIEKLTTMPVGVIYASVSVHMAKEEESKKQLVRPEQLSIYTVPPLQSKYVEEQPGYLQMGFASIHTTTGCYIGWCKSIYVFVKNGVMDTVQFGKGSRFKKIAYPLGLATLGAAVCYPVQSVIIAKVTGKKAYATSQQIYEAVKSLWTKSTKKESLPEPNGKTKLGISDETEIPAETTHILKHSVPLPTEFSSGTVIKSEPTSANCTSVTNFDDCPENITDFCPENIACACKDGEPFCKCPYFRGQWGNYWYMGTKCDQLWSTMDLILVATLPGVGLALIVGVTIQTIHYCKKKSKKNTDNHREQSVSSEYQPQHNCARAFNDDMRPQPDQGQVNNEIHLSNKQIYRRYQKEKYLGKKSLRN
ncbi:Apolipoprotein O-like protein [Heterocephalus glaber]|uniref:MICOS complex subunit n=1 Tax=Heterocephalus glaber TaxID=10181 RepID=G5AT33_HETGA|nr:Apolipoprotein O-like protein [Heterocephalus glaber]